MRSTRPESTGSRKKVSCICRAGWSGPRLRASKLSHSPRAPDPRRPPSPCRRTRRRGAGHASSMGWRAPGWRRSDGHGDVDALLDEDPLVALGLELGLAGGERLRPPGPAPGRRACRPRPWRSAAGLRSRGWRGRGRSSHPGAPMRTALRSSSEPAAATAARACSTAASTFCAGRGQRPRRGRSSCWVRTSACVRCSRRSGLQWSVVESGQLARRVDAARTAADDSVLQSRGGVAVRRRRVGRPPRTARSAAVTRRRRRARLTAAARRSAHPGGVVSTVTVPPCASTRPRTT